MPKDTFSAISGACCFNTKNKTKMIIHLLLLQFDISNFQILRMFTSPEFFFSWMAIILGGHREWNHFLVQETVGVFFFAFYATSTHFTVIQDTFNTKHIKAAAHPQISTTFWAPNSFQWRVVKWRDCWSFCLLVLLDQMHRLVSENRAVKLWHSPTAW